jgi:CubicO group peptidase (beta-lactamase class C family)
MGYGYQWWSARTGKHHFNFAWGHGGQFIVLLDELDMVIVTTADPFFAEHSGDSWTHEKATMNLVADFINALPSE